MTTQIIENATIGTDKVTHLPMFGIQRFREFLDSPRVWGKKGNVYWDDVLIHIMDNGSFYTFTNEDEDETNLINDDFLKNFSDKAIIYVESGFVLATDNDSKTRFARVASKGDQKEWLNDLASIIQAWNTDYYQELRVDVAA